MYCMYMDVYLFDVGADSDLKPRIATALFCGRRYESMSQQSRVTTSVLYNTTLCAFTCTGSLFYTTCTCTLHNQCRMHLSSRCMCSACMYVPFTCMYRFNGYHRGSVSRSEVETGSEDECY